MRALAEKWRGENVFFATWHERELVEFARALVSQAYEEAARVAEKSAAVNVAIGMHAEPVAAHGLAARHAEAKAIARRILALKDSP